MMICRFLVIVALTGLGNLASADYSKTGGWDATRNFYVLESKTTNVPAADKTFALLTIDRRSITYTPDPLVLLNPLSDGTVVEYTCGVASWANTEENALDNCMDMVYSCAVLLNGDHADCYDSSVRTYFRFGVWDDPPKCKCGQANVVQGYTWLCGAPAPRQEDDGTMSNGKMYARGTYCKNDPRPPMPSVGGG